MSRKSHELARDQIEQSCGLKEGLLNDELVEIIVDVGALLNDTFRKGKKVLLFGNGGSASDAQHIAAELVGKYRVRRKGLPAIALTCNTSSLTAISNDYSFNLVFARQIEALGRSRDVAIGITTSGKSKNVIEGFRAARKAGLITVALTGMGGRHLRNSVNHCICAPSNDTPRIQEIHILIGHILCAIVEDRACGRS